MKELVMLHKEGIGDEDGKIIVPVEYKKVRKMVNELYIALDFYNKYLLPPNGKSVAENTMDVLLKAFC